MHPISEVVTAYIEFLLEKTFRTRQFTVVMKGGATSNSERSEGGFRPTASPEIGNGSEIGERFGIRI